MPEIDLDRILVKVDTDSVKHHGLLAFDDLQGFEAPTIVVVEKEHFPREAQCDPIHIGRAPTHKPRRLCTSGGVIGEDISEAVDQSVPMGNSCDYRGQRAIDHRLDVVRDDDVDIETPKSN